VISAGSFGLQRLKRGEDAEKHLRAVTNEGFTIEFQGVTYTSGPQAAIIQPFLQEIFGGEVSLIYFGRELCNSVLKIAKAGDIRSHPGYGAKVISHTPSPEELRVGDLVIDSVEEPHFARIDLVRTSMGPRVIEVELIEPFLFFDMFPETAEPFANHIIDFLKG
jgi:glutathione synthase/RimK-type ligase-like ATP-grasp enzyme